MLPVVLERKTWSDLSSSVGDGRFESQSQKMLRCGLPLKVYLVEGDHVNEMKEHAARLDELACLRGFHLVLTHNHHKTIVILSAPAPPHRARLDA